MKVIDVVCGIISAENKIFIARRKEGKSNAGLWEFPGGKIEKGETEQECLHRELKEELGMQVNIKKRVDEHIHLYPHINIRLIAYRCTFVSATYKLTDHDNYKWVKKEELMSHNIADADIPLIKLI